MIVGFVGLIGSGKDTAASILVEKRGFKKIAFADPLKDLVSTIFKWDRDLLAGVTQESRVWREQKDEYWSEKFGSDVTPRYMLQYIGTEVMRKTLNDKIWILSAIATIEKNPERDYVFTDIRFINEIEALRDIGAKIIRIKRGDEPEWFETAKNNHHLMPKLYPNIHQSEWDWVRSKDLTTIDNSDTLGVLTEKIIRMI
jgi:dephospho-CoA kinase